MRTPIGRACASIRDSEVSASAMGVNVVLTKAVAFGVSSFFTGIAGAFFGHFATAFNYETFNVIMSITILLMIVVGGVGSIHGAFFGAIVITLLPVLISFLRDFIFQGTAINLMALPGIETGIFSLILILVIFCSSLLNEKFRKYISTKSTLIFFPLCIFILLTGIK